MAAGKGGGGRERGGGGGWLYVAMYLQICESKGKSGQGKGNPPDGRDHRQLLSVLGAPGVAGAPVTVAYGEGA